MVAYLEKFSDSGYNTAIAAAAAEVLQSSLSNRGQYAPFNRLEIVNRDSVAIKINLDGNTEGGRIYEIPPGASFTIQPEEGIEFSFIKQTNLDAAVAQTADTILFRWAKCERIA
jgi:hypothetical protein